MSRKVNFFSAEYGDFKSLRLALLVNLYGLLFGLFLYSVPNFYDFFKLIDNAKFFLCIIVCPFFLTFSYRHYLSLYFFNTFFKLFS